VQVGKDQRVVHVQIHILISTTEMLRGDERCINFGA